MRVVQHNETTLATWLLTCQFFLSHLVPAFLGTYEDIKESVVMYSLFLAGLLQVEDEFALCRQQEASMVTTAAAAAERCSPIIT